MSSPADRIKPYAALSHIYGANSYGVPRGKWGKMTAKQKTAFRGRLYRERIKADPEAHAEYKARVNGHLEWKECYARWKAANRDRQNAYNRAYRKRAKAREAMNIHPNEVYAIIVKAIPRAWPKHMQDDIAGMICLDILENRATLDRVDHLVKAASTRFHRTMETWKTKSLDAPMGGTDLRRIDLLEAPAPYDGAHEEEDRS
ncbi:hypothetical protein NKJ71_16685 [Mesorhizobium sp. M0050]|uniref:hypothetical protein n=1 Tax=Mesorhizobium sp. M0050 TaxID=2956861 RepID=UPI00333C3F5C